MYAVILILDSVGIGEAPDADAYGDVGANTIGHIAQAVGGLKLPNLQRLGLGNIAPIEGVAAASEPLACFGKMMERSAGKDTTTGHWEIAGIITERPFPLYPQGFPPEVIQPFEKAICRRVLGNRAASGTEIIQELGEEHMRTGSPIVYTSADSVFQIAAHESVIPVEELYEMCRIARSILTGEHAVSRVIARPFAGLPGKFERTAARKDFSLEPPRETLLDAVSAAGMPVIAIGKIEDIFAGRGISRAVHTRDNRAGIEAVISELHTRPCSDSETSRGLVIANLVDFDMLYGHRNDPIGYARALSEFDSCLPAILDALRADDLLFITADHGCDPTTPGTDHTREYVPLLALRSGMRLGRTLGTRSSFCDISATVREALGLNKGECGESFLRSLFPRCPD